MGVLDNIRGRDTSQLNAAAHNSESTGNEKSPGHAQDITASDSDTLSLEAHTPSQICLLKIN